MRSLNKYFENKNINYDKLCEYGFTKINDNYFYEKIILDNRFKVIVEISKEKQISKLIDLSMDEEYVLVDVEKSSGEFVGRVREEYESVLNDIIKKCSLMNVFKTKQAKCIINYIKETYNDDLEYLWEKFPNNAIWRNKENNKWYGLLFVIPESKLGIDSDREIEAINLKYQKDKTEDIIDNKNVFAGYHMSKKSWITIVLNENLDLNEIYKLIDNSYELSLKK